ncbi:MAG: ABC transporter ATP-binding protein [Algoriphagus sp.]|uniref:ABC transporter ATP-binding protein n=1 Tax=Algoriphagus sp. TaxID=1872435 RepID=UPI001812D405|nr:ABC transporter ATP-binding protein [Algoriphagus sp.]NVJ87808.1 ABC transporter ATP-binding protein [Algoriphagus sp.]
MRVSAQAFRSYSRVYQRALSLLWKVSPQLVLIQLVLFLFLSLIPVGVLAVTKQLFDTILTPEASFDQILFWLLILGGFQVLQVLLSQSNSYFSEIYQEKLTDSVNALILKKSIEIPYPYFEDPAYYDSLHLAQRQSIYKLPLLFQQIQGTFSNLLSLGLLIGYFFSLISSYAWVILVIALPLGIVKWISGFAIHRLEARTIPTEREASYYHYLLTDESYAHEIRTLNFGEALLQRFRDLRALIFKQKQSLQKRLLVYSLGAETLEVGVLIYILISMARKAVEGLMGISLLIVYIQGIQRMQNNLKSFLNSLVQLIQLRIFLSDIFRFMDISDQSIALSGDQEFPEDDFGIQVEDMNFRYSDNQEESLKNISMEFETGKVVGIVGANGSGKSTLVKVLAGLYTPNQGRICIGNKPLELLDAQSFRNNTLFFFQDFQDYFFSIEDVVSLGAEVEENYEERIHEALDKSLANEFVSRLPEGSKSKLGRVFENGRGLSGGQWQKLALARAFYRKAKILVLDEPTSALDAVSERKIFEQLRKGSSGKVTVLITHRLYNLKDADYIYVMDKGSVSQEGTFQDLIQQEGIFKEFYQQQVID